MLITVSSLSVKGKDNSIAFWDMSTKELKKSWRWILPAMVAPLHNSEGSILASGFKDNRETDVLCRLDKTSGEVLASCAVESPWFSVNDKGVWLNTNLGPQLLDLNTLAPVMTHKTNEILQAVSRSALYLNDGATVICRDLKGKRTALWNMPKIAGFAEYLDSLKVNGKETGVLDPDDLHNVNITIAPMEDKLVISNGLAMSIWTMDGKPLLLPSIG